MSPFSKWVLASRPKTLPAAIIPVMVGGALAASTGHFEVVPWTICLLFSLLIQTGTNFANDYYDFLSGADDQHRIGPSRAVASGWISPSAMKRGMILVFLLAFMTGSTLVIWGGWWLFIVGISSILCGIAYTGGPYPLGYNGWGDIFVLVFFGWIATGVTYYVQAGSFVLPLGSFEGVHWTLLAGLVPGALATNLLVVNNVRDAPLDKKAGKRTLVVRYGRSFGLWEYRVLSAVAVLVPVCFALVISFPGCWMVLLTAPLFWQANRKLAQAAGREAFEQVLVLTALLLMLVGGLFALGLAIGPI